MCGILGVNSNKKNEIKNNILPNRGPDDWGVYYDSFQNKYLSLFQSRLSIIGLGEQGHQPFVKNENYVLVFNGEIYNYKELKNELVVDFNIQFISSTDTEVLYECLINYGIEITLNKLNGMFAFCFYNKIEKTLTLVRDQLGIKPIYYYQKENNFAFSSEIKALFDIGISKPVLRRELLGEYFANGWIYEPDTLFSDFYKLKAGHCLSYDLINNKTKIIKYWDVTNLPYTASPNISEIIETQKISDVGYGIYLSGGIDSSLITTSLIKDEPFCLNLDLKDSESKRVEMFIKKYKINIHRICEIGLSIKLYDKLIYYMDEPIADAAIVPTYELARLSRKNDRIVMLSGLGGDELDAGYNRHFIIKNYNLFRFILSTPLRKLLQLLMNKRDYARLSSFFENPTPSNYFALTGYFTKSEIDNLILSEWFDDYSKKIENKISVINGKKKYFYLDFKGFLASHNLIYMDKASMMASVEVRVPLLDKDLVATFFQDIDTFRRFRIKPRLRKLLKMKLDGDYKSIKKEGFRYPYIDWMKKEVDWNDVLKFFSESKLINTEILRFWLAEMEKNMNIVSIKLLYVYTLYRWMKSYNVRIDNNIN